MKKYFEAVVEHSVLLFALSLLGFAKNTLEQKILENEERSQKNID